MSASDMQFSHHDAKVLIATAVGSLLVVTGFVLLGGFLTDGYSHTSQFISELGASGAELEYRIRFFGFFPAGVLLLAFCAVAARAFPQSDRFSLALFGLAIFAAGYVAAAFFPCDRGCRPSDPSFSHLIHMATGYAGYIIAPGFLYLFGNEVRTWPRARWLVIAADISFPIALIALLTLSPSSDSVGLSQRVLELSVLFWTVALAYYAWRHRVPA